MFERIYRVASLLRSTDFYSRKQIKKMCILFIYRGAADNNSDYSLIIATNRDEFYARPAQGMAPWDDDPHVIAGRDLKAGGTWLAVSPIYKKLAVLLNLPGSQPKTAQNHIQSRGKIAIDYVRSEVSTKEFISSMKDYFHDCSGFVLVTVDFGNTDSKVCSYTSSIDKLTGHDEQCLGFGNSFPDTPLKKVQVGKQKMEDVCTKFSQVHMKENLINQLLDLLKSEEIHLPDEVLEQQNPENYKELSSIYVCKENIYGTRTHTILLLTKTGHMDIIECTLRAPIDTTDCKWDKTEFQFDL